MKAKQVMEVLKIGRGTLCKYVHDGMIEVINLPFGRYDYVDASVYKLLGGNQPRKTVVYCRVSTPKQKKDLTNQVELTKQFCFNAGWQLHAVYQDVASGISFDKRVELFKLLEEVLAGRVERVVITYKDRLSRVGFELFSKLFERFGCKIIVISEVGSEKLDSQEIFEEIVSLLHCYSMRLYSGRRRQKVQELCQPE